MLLWVANGGSDSSLREDDCGHAVCGAADEGAPGDRGGGFYAGYFRDPDGNKLNAFVMGG